MDCRMPAAVRTPQPLAQAPAAVLAGIGMLLTDIDDTLTTGGRVTREAYEALWRAHDAGLRVVPVTGRPAGWCDAIARQWPVEGVVGENGALYYRVTPRGMTRVYAQDATLRAANRRRLEAIRDAVLAEVPGCAVAADQPFRLFDLAIDFREDVPPLSRADVARIVACFTRAGATAKVSSIHVNGWFGAFDKLTMSRRLIADLDGAPPESHPAAYAFCGDSPNDEPLFAAFQQTSCAVANIADFLADLRHPPAWIAGGVGGAGFAEVVDAILRARATHHTNHPPPEPSP
jgi:HAD superfamily hydrolase (TIGR01484 family)